MLTALIADLGAMDKVYLQQIDESSACGTNRRHFARLEVHCRARIRIGTRYYAGYLHNISQGGAKLRTISPIRKMGEVILTLPDLPPLRCQLRWNNSYNAGVSFHSAVHEQELSRWIGERAALADEYFAFLAEIADSEPDLILW